MSDNVHSSWAQRSAAKRAANLTVVASNDGPPPTEGQPVPRPKTTDPLTLLPFSGIQPVLDSADFVQGVLVSGSAVVVYGESNAGKTFWITDLALHVAAGIDWNGRRVEQGAVVYCVLEGGNGFNNRVSAWRTDHGLDDAQIPFFAICCGLNLLDPEADTQRLVDAIKSAGDMMGVPVKLVIIDTLARAFAGGNENASEDMGLLVSNMDYIRAETRACVGFVHHSGKDQAKGARGHSSLRAAIDTEIEVVADEEAGTKTASIVKQREMKKGQAFGFTLEPVVLGQNRHGEDVTTCLVRSADPATPKKKEPRLSGAAFAGLTALREALAKTGQTGTIRDVPAGVATVPIEVWRREFYGRSTLDSQEARKKAFQRAGRDLIDGGFAVVMNDHAWIIRDPS